MLIESEEKGESSLSTRLLWCGGLAWCAGGSAVRDACARRVASCTCVEEGIDQVPQQDIDLMDTCVNFVQQKELG